MQHFRKWISVASLSAAVALGCVSAAQAEAKKEFKVAWSIYAGWMPWGYAKDHGIVKKWADKYGISIDVTQFNDYVESMNQYTAGAFDAVTLTNMDGLSIPAAGGVDTTAVIVGDFSNGNDAVILKNKDKLADIKGQNINLVEFSVSHYLLARALSDMSLALRARIDATEHRVVVADQPEPVLEALGEPLVDHRAVDHILRRVAHRRVLHRAHEARHELVVHVLVDDHGAERGTALAGCAEAAE